MPELKNNYYIEYDKETKERKIGPYIVKPSESGYCVIRDDKVLFRGILRQCRSFIEERDGVRVLNCGTFYRSIEYADKRNNRDGQYKKGSFTQQELEFIMTHNWPVVEMSKILNRSPHTIEQARYSICKGQKAYTGPRLTEFPMNERRINYQEGKSDFLKSLKKLKVFMNSYLLATNASDEVMKTFQKLSEESEL